MDDTQKLKEMGAKLQDEIADVLSWIFALSNKLDQIGEVDTGRCSTSPCCYASIVRRAEDSWTFMKT